MQIIVYSSKMIKICILATEGTNSVVQIGSLSSILLYWKKIVKCKLEHSFIPLSSAWIESPRKDVVLVDLFVYLALILGIWISLVLPISLSSSFETIGRDSWI